MRFMIVYHGTVVAFNSDVWLGAKLRHGDSLPAAGREDGHGGPAFVGIRVGRRRDFEQRPGLLGGQPVGV